jgi:glycosyltransferase involved in cell wall biosynthesis
MAGQLVELGVPLSGILVEPTGAPVFGRTPANGPGEDNHFLFVGRLVPCKAVETIIDAVAVANDGGGTVRLSIVGDGPLRGALEQQAQDVAQSQAITFLGAQPSEEVDRLLDLVGGLVIHTVDKPGGPEAFGVVVTEAMAACRPVITSRCGGLTDQITDGEQGIVVEQRDVEALASAFRRLGEDPELRMRMGRAARLRAEERFDATVLARELEAVVIKIAGERAS